MHQNGGDQRSQGRDGVGAGSIRELTMALNHGGNRAEANSEQSRKFGDGWGWKEQQK